MLKQIAAVATTNLRSIPARWGASAVVVIGIAGVVGVTVSILAMAKGFEEVFASAGRADRAVVMRGGDDNGMSSAISRDQLPLVLGSPGFKRGADGKPLASPQKFMTSVLTERKSGEESNVLLRGVGAAAQQVWPEIKLVEGRWFTSGRRELIVGRVAQQQYVGLEVGQQAQMTNGPWTVVGVFEAPGTVYESELWGDAEMVFAGFSITGQFSSVVGIVELPEGLKTLGDAITTNPRLSHIVKSEPEFYASQTGLLGKAMLALGYVVGAIMALGALFSAVNTMHAAVKARSLEIATLRAIGFGGAPIVLSVLLESVVLCALGALLGGALSWLMFNGETMSTIGGQNFNQVAFAFRVSAGLILQGVLAACVIGLIGGLVPAIRAARLPVATALRGA
jgi:putative ABC transport system permease protein